MIAPGIAGYTVGANPTVTRWISGFGIDSNGNLCIDTDAPAGATYNGGFRVNANGAIYGTTTTTGSRHIQGVRISDVGAVVYEAAAPQSYVNRNPIRTNGALATS